jgi:hypothetical protein
LIRPEFTVVVQPRAEEIAALAPAADDDVPPGSNPDAELPSSPDVQIEPARTSAPPAPTAAVQPAGPPKLHPETPEEAAERERRYREILGIPEPRPRRRWRLAR